MNDEPSSLYDDVQLTLENDGRFYKWCLTRLIGLRSDVSDAHWRNTLKYFYPPASQLSMREQATMRKYFFERWINPKRIPDRPDAAILTTTVVPLPLPEKAVSNKLSFKTQFLLNGVPIEQHTKESVYESIAAEEKRIDKLREIKHQPRSLVAEIEAAEATLQALVEHLDGV